MSIAIFNLFGQNPYIATFVMSMIPLIELKGGIVFGWQYMYPWLAFLYAFAGSTLVFFIVFFLLKPILALLKKWKAFNGLAIGVENYFSEKANKALEDGERKNKKKVLSERARKMLDVFIFVAIPLPMTGVWTGTAIAVFLGLKFHEAVLPIVVGNFIAGGLICGLSALCNLIGINLDIVLWILFGIAVVMLILFIVKIVMSKRKKQTTSGDKKE